MDQFVDHFKNLISNDNVDNGPDTTDTMECVFEELDKPFTENEIETCIRGLNQIVAWCGQYFKWIYFRRKDNPNTNTR